MRVCSGIDGSALDAADAAVVARLVGSNEGFSSPSGRILTFEVEQRVKGDVGGRVDVRSPTGTDCDLDVHEAQTIGLLLTRMPTGEWLGTACSVVDPGELVAAGGEPRGPIKVGIGIVISASCCSSPATGCGGDCARSFRARPSRE